MCDVKGLPRLIITFTGILLLFGGILLMAEPYLKGFIENKANDKKVEQYQSKHAKQSKTDDDKKKTPVIPKERNKVAGIIEVPDAKIKEPIYPGEASPEQLSRGVSFAEKDESMDDQNIAIAGHTSNVPNLKKNYQFTNLDKAKKGSKVYLTVDGQKRTYKMTSIRNVKPNKGDVMDEKKGKKNQITLITCDNYNDTTGEWDDRQIFVAEEIS